MFGGFSLRRTRAQATLFELSFSVLYPPAFASTAGVSMRPVNHASAIVPFVLPTERHRVTDLHRHPWSQIDIVAQKDGVIGVQTHDESLVPRAIQVVGQNPHHFASRSDHDAGTLISKCVADDPQVVLTDIRIRPTAAPDDRYRKSQHH